MSLLPRPPSCLCQFLSPNVNLFFFFVFFQWDVGLVARGATGSGIARGGGGKTRGEGEEKGEVGRGKRGERGGRRGRGSKMIVNMGGGGWVCTFKIGTLSTRTGVEDDALLEVKSRISIAVSMRIGCIIPSCPRLRREGRSFDVVHRT